MAQMGRPRTFDRQEAINQAMQLFWAQGYESTSLSQLKANMGKGITAPSFYAAFGSKEALFQEVVQHYLNTYARVTEPLWDDDLLPREAVELALRQSAKMQCESSHPKGCMVALSVMSATSPENEAVCLPLKVSRKRTSDGFVRCVERAIQQGTLSKNTNAIALAMTLNSFLLGLSTIARDGGSFDEFDQAINQVMHLWDSYAVK